MSEVTLESLARRLEDVERRLNEKEATSGKDCMVSRSIDTTVQDFRNRR